jgi:hypothetical protein
VAHFGILWVAPSGRIMKNEIIEKLKAVLVAIKAALVWTSTNPREGADKIEYLHLPNDKMQLLLELAMLREKESDFWEVLTKAFSTKFKTAQTVQDKSETSRKDTLDKKAKRICADKLVEKLFTIIESEASQNKKTMASMKELVAALKIAQAAKDTDRVAEITQAMAEAME